MTATIDYSAGGPLTDLSTIRRGAFADLPEDPVAICRLVHRLVIHWVIEFSADGSSWVRADPEAMGLTVLPTPEALVPGQFLTGGEAWSEFRAGRIDPATFGVWGTENFGPAEIRGNAIRDLASLNRVETLPWDEWGRMEASYQGRTGADYDALLDTVATACAGDDPAEVAALYKTEDLQVPPALIA